MSSNFSTAESFISPNHLTILFFKSPNHFFKLFQRLLAFSVIVSQFCHSAIPAATTAPIANAIQPSGEMASGPFKTAGAAWTADVTIPHVLVAAVTAMIPARNEATVAAIPATTGPINDQLSLIKL